MHIFCKKILIFRALARHKRNRKQAAAAKPLVVLPATFPIFVIIILN